MDNLTTDNQGAVPTDNQPQVEPVSQPTGTGENGGQAVTGEAPAVDLFKGIDPNKLPPEAKAHYDSMLRDYRDKTTKLSETIKAEVAKATETYKQKTELYDQIAAQEEFVKQWNEYVQKTNSSQNQQSAGDPAIEQLKTQLSEIRDQLQIEEMTKITEAFAGAENEKGERIHPEFDKLNEVVIGTLKNKEGSEDFSLLRACIELSPMSTPQERLASGYKMAKQVYDAIFEEGRKAGLGKLQSKVLSGSQPPTNVGGNLSVTEKKPKNAHEALEMARRGMMVSRE